MSRGLGRALTLGQMLDEAAARDPAHEAIVFRMGEAVMAFVIPKAGESLTAEEIAAFARGKIANFKVPKYVEIVDSFPLTGSGKVQKFKQRATPWRSST